MLILSLLTTNLVATPVSTSTSLIDLSKSQLEFKIAENYFSDILNAQLVIFALIVTILSAVSVYLQYRTTKGQINKEVKKSTKVMRKNMKAEFMRNMGSLDKKISERFDSLEVDVIDARANVYRSMALFWDSQKSYGTAFIWWIRAAYEFSKPKFENLTKIALSKAKDSANLIASATELTPNDVSEYQRLTTLIDDKLYKSEKDLLDQAMKSTLGKTIK